ncbi:hypothetical protein F4810DRAFT_600796 [Camillea tinctor]|nr:hypothetical protein F4810DRAFT_600796 [Camillea tinctor]
MDGNTVPSHCIDNSPPADMKGYIDSLLAAVSFSDAVNYSDEVDRNTKLQRDLTIPTSRLGFSSLPSQPNQPPVNARLFEGSEYTSVNTYEKGWGLLRSFIQKTDEFYTKLREHTPTHNCTFIERWLETYHSPARLRQDGLLVLRDIYCDKSPPCSLGCFAAMIVQHSIRDITLYKSDRSDSAVFGWKDILLKPTEGEELDCLYNELSQRDSSNLVVPQGIIQGQNAIPASQEYLQVGGQFDSEPPQPPLQQPQPNLSSLGGADIDVEWYNSPNPSYSFQQEPGQPSFGFGNDELRPGDRYDVDYSLSPTFNASFPMSFAPSPTPEFPPQMHSVHPIQPSPVSPSMPASSHPQPSYPHRDDNRPGDAVSVLKESQPFQIFIKFLSDLGTFLDFFSVKRAVGSSENPEDQLSGSFARRRYSDFVKDVQQLLFNSLSSSSRSFSADPAVIGIIAAAGLMVSVGNLQCLRQVEEYLTSLGQVSLVFA